MDRDPGRLSARGLIGATKTLRLHPAVRESTAAPPRDTHHDPRTRQAAAVARVPGVERVLLFGSRTRGDHRDDSDTDLLVVRPRDP